MTGDERGRQQQLREVVVFRRVEENARVGSPLPGWVTIQSD